MSWKLSVNAAEESKLLEFCFKLRKGCVFQIEIDMSSCR